MFSLKPPRHISTLPFATEQFNARSCHCPVCTVSDQNGGGWRSSRGSPSLVTGVALHANFRQM